MIRKTIFNTVIATVAGILLVLAASSWAGQVVKKEDKLAAQGMIHNEKTLKPPPQKNTLAVLYFKNKTGRPELDPLQKGIALMLITDLAKIESLQVVERIQMQALVEELGLGTSGLVDPATAPRIGKLLQARWLVGGDILTSQRENLRLQSSLTDVGTQNVLASPFSEGKISDLIQLEKTILFDVIQTLKIEPTAKEAENLKIPCSTNLQALLALFKGVDESDQGHYAQAAEYYEKALKEDANVCIAKQAIEELQIRGLTGGKKKTPDLLRSLQDRTSVTNQLSPKDTTKRERKPASTTAPVDMRLNFPDGGAI